MHTHKPSLLTLLRIASPYKYFKIFLGVFLALTTRGSGEWNKSCSGKSNYTTIHR